MKKPLSILILLALLMQFANKGLIVLAYQYNQKYVTEHFCINKAKPIMHCNGKCHLAKELKKEDKKDNSATNATKALEEYCPVITKFTFNNPFVVLQNTAFALYFDHYSFLAHFSVFRPPLTA